MPVADQLERRPPVKRADADGRVERERLRMMMLIRRFEERTYQEYTKPGQKIGGFCHLYSGQEAIAVGTAAIFDKTKDYLINGYRCHGHSLALGMNPRAGDGGAVRQSHRLLQGQGRLDALSSMRRSATWAATASSAGRFRSASGWRSPSSTRRPAA